MYGITAESEGEIVYSDVVSATMNSQGLSSIIIEDIPAQSNVTIEHLYCSLGANLVSEQITNTPVEAEMIQSVSYSYDRSGVVTQGHAYVNIKNTYDKEKGESKLNCTESYNHNLNINVKIEGRKAIVSVKNSGGKDCYVRLKVLTKESVNGNTTLLWEPDYDYYNYTNILQSNGTSGELTFEIEEIEKDFNTVIVVESTDVHYTEDGTPYPDWDAIQDEGGSGAA